MWTITAGTGVANVARGARASRANVEREEKSMVGEWTRLSYAGMYLDVATE